MWKDGLKKRWKLLTTTKEGLNCMTVGGEGRGASILATEVKLSVGKRNYENKRRQRMKRKLLEQNNESRPWVPLSLQNAL